MSLSTMIVCASLLTLIVCARLETSIVCASFESLAGWALLGWLPLFAVFIFVASCFVLINRVYSVVLGMVKIINK